MCQKRDWKNHKGRCAVPSAAAQAYLLPLGPSLIPADIPDFPGRLVCSSHWTLADIIASTTDLHRKVHRPLVAAATEYLTLSKDNVRDQTGNQMISVSVKFHNSLLPTKSRYDLDILGVDVVDIHKWYVGQSERLATARKPLAGKPCLLIGYTTPKDLVDWAGSTFAIDLSNSILPATARDYVEADAGTVHGKVRVLAEVLEVLRRKVVGSRVQIHT